MEHPGIFLYLILFGNISQNVLGNFFQIFRQYVMTLFHKYSTNIYFADGWYLIDFNTKIKKTLEV